MKKSLAFKRMQALFLLCALLSVVSVFFFKTVVNAEETTTTEAGVTEINVDDSTSTVADNGLAGKALASGIAIGLAALGGAIGMGMAISKSAEGISRQPEAEGKIRTALMLGLVFIETVVIYALIVTILIVFVM